MKNILLLLLISFFCSSATVPLQQTIEKSLVTQQSQVVVKSQKQSFQLLKKAMELKLGRHLTFKEKITLRVQRFLYPDDDLEARANRQAQNGFIFALLGWIIFMPLLIPGFILSNSALQKDRENPGILSSRNYMLAKAGKIMSIAGLIILMLALILIMAQGGFYYMGS